MTRIVDPHTTARTALAAALDATGRMQGDPQPDGLELANWLRDNGYAIVHVETARPSPSWTRTSEPDAATAAHDLFRAMILDCDGTDSPTVTAVAAAVARQIENDFQIHYEHHVNIDHPGPTRGTPEDPNVYVRRLVMYGPYSHDPDGPTFYRHIAAQLGLIFAERAVERSTPQDT